MLNFQLKSQLKTTNIKTYKHFLKVNFSKWKKKNQNITNYDTQMFLHFFIV